ANPNPQSLVGFYRQGEAVRGHDTLERLADIRCPTLVSVADADILVPPRFSRDIAQRVAGAELEIIVNAGHAYMWEKPEAFQRDVSRLSRASPLTRAVIFPSRMQHLQRCARSQHRSHRASTTWRALRRHGCECHLMAFALHASTRFATSAEREVGHAGTGSSAGAVSRRPYAVDGRRMVGRTR